MQTTTPPLTRDVLHPELRKLVDTNELDFTQLTQRMYANPVTNGELSSLKQSVDSRAFYNLNGTTAHTPYVNALVTGFLLLENSKMETIMQAIALVGVTISSLQIGAVIGTAPNTSPWYAGMGRKMFSLAEITQFANIVTTTLAHIGDNFPIYAQTIEETDKICFGLAREMNKNGMLSDPTVMNATYFLGIQPLVRALFVASFIDSPRQNVSVYDKRTAELLLMTCVSQGIFRVIDELLQQPNQPTLPGGMLASEKLAQLFVAVIIDFYTRQEIQVGDDAFTKIYDNVSKLSVENAELKKYVENANAALEMRKQDAVTMNQHKALDEKRKHKSKTVFYLWISTLIIVLLVAGILLMKGSYKSLMIHNIVLLCVILLIVMFGYILSKLR